MKFFNSSIKKNIYGLIAFSVILAVVPIIIHQNYLISMLVQCLLFAAMGVSWNLIGGYAGCVSLGHSAFLAVGAYSAYIMYLDLGITPFVGLLAGVLCAAILSFFIGKVCLRLRGTFFSLSTIAFAEIFKNLLLHFRDFTGGAYGLILTYTGSNPINLQFQSKIPFYYIALIILVLIIVFNIFFENSKDGYYLKAIGEDEDAIRSLGLNTSSVKLKTYVISACLISVVGSFYGFYLTYIMPTSIASTAISIKIIVIAVIGGAGILWGPVLGAFVVIPLTELVNATLGSLGGANTMIYGVALILIIIFQPKGLIGMFMKDGTIHSSVKKIRTRKQEV